MKKRYHCELGFPEINLPSGVITLSFTEEARRFCKKRTYLKIPSELDLDLVDFVEVEIKNNKIADCLLKLKYNRKNDLCFIVDINKQLVKTMWVSERNSKHYKLNIDDYTLA